MGPNERGSRSVTHEKIMARSAGMCERCGLLGESDHHRLNRSQGGKWSCDNIIRLCGDGTRGCHGWVTRHPEAAALEGYHVRSWDDPAKIPVRVVRAEYGEVRKFWVRLREDGLYDQMPNPFIELD